METESAIKDWRTKTNEFVSTGADRQTERQKLTTIPSAPSPVVAVAVVAVLVTLVKHNTTGCVPPSRLPPEGSCYSGTFQKGLAQAPGGFQEASRSSGASERLQQLLEASGWTPTMSWADPLLTPKRMADGYIVCYNLPPPSSFLPLSPSTGKWNASITWRIDFDSKVIRWPLPGSRVRWPFLTGGIPIAETRPSGWRWRRHKLRRLQRIQPNQIHPNLSGKLDDSRDDYRG